MSWVIGIDFGTSRSAGAVGEIEAQRGGADAKSGRDGFSITTPTVSPLEIEGNRWMPSMVLQTVEGDLVVGSAADNLAGVYPERLERTPKRALGGGQPLLLGGQPVDPRDAAAAVMRVIIAEGRLRHGAEPSGAIVTHPVRWAGVRRTALAQAAVRAGLPEVQLLEEPVAAAIHYASEHVDMGAHVGVYDLGGGTFDTAVLQRTDRGFEVIGAPGGDENIGGENFDYRLFSYFISCLADTDSELASQLMTSDERKWKRAALDLLAQARRAKEALSSYTSTQVFVPIADRDIVVNRSQFEAMIIDDVERTVDLMQDTVLDAGVTMDQLAAVFLVGGSSRVPLVAQLATERFASLVMTRDEPKGVVALGAARLAAMHFLGPGRQRSASTAATSTPVALTDTPAELIDPPPPAQAATALPAPVALAWRLALGDSTGQLAADIDAIAVVGLGGLVRCIDPRRGEIRWQQNVGAASWCAPALADDCVAIGGADGQVFLLDRDSGKLRWSMSVGAAIVCTPLIVEDLVFVGNDAGHLIAIDRTLGTVRWDLPVGAAVRAGLVADGPDLVVATTAGQVFAVDRTTGRPRWGYRTSGQILLTPAITHDRILVPCRDGIVHALRLADGVAQYGIRCVGAPVTPVAATDGLFAVVDEIGWLRVHRSEDGQTVKELNTGSRQAAGVVLVPTSQPELAVVETGGELRSLELATGKPRFSLATGSGNRSIPVASGGLVCVGTNFGQLYAVIAP